MSSTGGTPLIPIFPAVPRPPAEWNTNYANELTRWLNNVASQISGFTYVRLNGMMVASTFPQTGYGLRVGEVFSNDGILTVVQADENYLGPLSMTGAVGTITVHV